MAATLSSITDLITTNGLAENYTTGETLNTTIPADKYAPYTKPMAQIWIYGGLPTLILGIIGHTLGIVVILYRKKSRKTPATIYLVSLSFAGIILLIIPLLQIVLKSMLKPEQPDPFREHTRAGCKIHVQLTYAILHFCAWLQATIAIDRLLFVATPLKYKLIVTWQRAIIVIVSEFCVLLTADSVFAYYVDIRDGKCTYRAELVTFHIPLSYFDTILYSILPGLLMIVIYVVIVIIYSRTRINIGTSRKSDKTGEKMGVVFFALNVVFLVTSLPSCIILIILAYDRNMTPEQEIKMNTIGLTVTSVLSYLGSACTFIVYCLAGSQFRNTLKEIVCGRNLSASGKRSPAVTKTTSLVSNDSTSVMAPNSETNKSIDTLNTLSK